MICMILYDIQLYEILKSWNCSDLHVGLVFLRIQCQNFQFKKKKTVVFISKQLLISSQEIDALQVVIDQLLDRGYTSHSCRLAAEFGVYNKNLAIVVVSVCSQKKCCKPIINHIIWSAPQYKVRRGWRRGYAIPMISQTWIKLFWGASLCSGVNLTNY